MYYIFEIQEGHDGKGAVVTPIKTAETKNEALSKYHSVLAYAAISKVAIHTVFVVNGEGQYLARETYQHPVEVEAGDEA